MSLTLCLLRIVNGTIERVANMVGVSICLISWTTASMPNWFGLTSIEVSGGSEKRAKIELLKLTIEYHQELSFLLQ